MTRVWATAVAGLALVLSGCASIVSESESTTYIETDPETARCELHGQDFKRVVTTPTSIHLPADEVAFVADNPGDWLFHCHILEHHLAGKGSIVRVG